MKTFGVLYQFKESETIYFDTKPVKATDSVHAREKLLKQNPKAKVLSVAKAGD